MRERGSSAQQPLRREFPPLPPPAEGRAVKSFPKPKESVPPPRIDVTGDTFLADASLVPEAPASEAEKKRTEGRGSKQEIAPTEPEATREQERKGPIFEAASNVPGKRGPAGVAVNPETGTFIFVAGDNAEPNTVEGVIDSALERLEEGAPQQDARSYAHGEVTRARASEIETRLMSAAARGAEDTAVREHAHKLARGDKTSNIDVPPFVVGQIFNEEITPMEFYGSRDAEEQIGTLVNKGTAGLDEMERESAKKFSDAQEKYRTVHAEVKQWLGGDPLARWPTKTDLEADTSLNQDQRDIIAAVFEAQDAYSGVAPEHAQLANNLEVAKILTRKLEETRQRRLTETDEEFEETYRELKNDPELAKLAAENLPVLLKRLRESVVLSPETSGQHAVPELNPAAKEHVEEAAKILNGLFDDFRAAKDDAARDRVLNNINIARGSDRLKQLMGDPKSKLALYQKIGKKFPASDRTLEVMFRSESKAVSGDPEKAERLVEPALNEEESKTANDLTYEMKRAMENPMSLLKEPRFTSLSREGRFVVVSRLKNLGVVKPEQATELLQARRLMLRGKPGEALTVFKVGRDGSVTKVDTGARAGTSSEEFDIGKSGLETTKRKVSQRANAAVDIGVKVGDQIVIVPSSSEEYVMGQLERAGTERIEQVLAELKGDPNRSAKVNSDRLKNTTKRPHLVLRIPE